jgi:hypothetical protein
MVTADLADAEATETMLSPANAATRASVFLLFMYGFSLVWGVAVVIRPVTASSTTV